MCVCTLFTIFCCSIEVLRDLRWTIVFNLAGHEMDWDALFIPHRWQLNMNDTCIAGHPITEANGNVTNKTNHAIVIKGRAIFLNSFEMYKSILDSGVAWNTFQLLNPVIHIYICVYLTLKKIAMNFHIASSWIQLHFFSFSTYLYALLDVRGRKINCRLRLFPVYDQRALWLVENIFFYARKMFLAGLLSRRVPLLWERYYFRLFVTFRTV